MNKKLATILAGGALALSLSACSAADFGYYDAYSGPPYVVGKYTCVNPYSGQLDYCVEYSDGTSQLVPWGIYDTIDYGYGLTYYNHRYTVVRTSYSRSGGAPDVYHVTYHARTGGTTTSSYGGMSYRNSSGRVIYSSGSATSYRTSYRSSSSFRSK